MKKASRVILEIGNYIVLIKRKKRINGKLKEFYAIPGGIVEETETWEEAAVREAKEELDVDIIIDSMFAEEYNEDLDKMERFYFAKIVKGNPKNGKGEEFQNQDINGNYGTYDVVMVSKNEIGSYNILPVTIKDKLVALYI